MPLSFHLEHFASHDRALLDVARLGERIALELLDAERDALLLDIDVEHHGLDRVALLKLSITCSPGSFQSRSDRMNHAVHVALEPEE